MIKRFARSFLASCALAVITTGAGALPVLQLGILGATYDSPTETSIATTNPFTLYAFLTPGNGAKPSDVTAYLADTYYISAALTPKVGPTPATLGSFKFDGTTVTATTDMTYGVAPIETIGALSGQDAGDLPDHGIFDTFFKEFSFNFSSANQFSPLDVEPNASLAGLTAGTGMYYKTFTVDISNLNPAYAVHFDLYASTVCADGKGQCNVAGDVDVDKFAPFSHDAQSLRSDGGGGGQTEIPEPGSLALAGLALLGAFAMRRRKL